jgi:hypothetical protein
MECLVGWPNEEQSPGWEHFNKNHNFTNLKFFSINTITLQPLTMEQFLTKLVLTSNRDIRFTDQGIEI